MQPPSMLTLLTSQASTLTSRASRTGTLPFLSPMEGGLACCCFARACKSSQMQQLSKHNCQCPAFILPCVHVSLCQLGKCNLWFVCVCVLPECTDSSA